MTELILGRNNDNYNKKQDSSSKKNNSFKLKTVIMHNIDDSRHKNYSSENHSLFHNHNNIKRHNELDEINENFDDINEISVSEKTDNISNISADKNNLNINLFKTQKLERDKEIKSNIINEDEINKENKPRFAISHRLSKIIKISSI